MRIAGIDYSINSPAICVHQGEFWSFDHCSFFYRAKKLQTFEVGKAFFEGEPIKPYSSQEQRFYQNADWITDVILDLDVEFVLIEGYSLGSKGRTFDIAENTAILKHLLWKSKIPFDTVPPTVVKKSATGKGIGDKLKMQEAFFEAVPAANNLRELLGQTKASMNPSSDIIDSYYLARYAFFHVSKDSAVKSIGRNLCKQL